MKTILVCGVEDTGKEEIVRLSIQGMKGINHIKFSSFIQYSKRAFSTPEKIFNLRAAFNKRLLNSLEENTSKTLIVSGDFGIKTRFGFIPIITKNIFDAINPDYIIRLDLDTRLISFIPKHGIAVRKNQEKIMEMKNYQDINKAFLNGFSASHGVIVNNILMKKDNVKEVIKEMRNLFDFILE